MADRTFSTLSQRANVRGATRRAIAQLFLMIESDRPWAGSSRHLLEDIDEVLITRGSERRFQRLREGGSSRLVICIPDGRISTAHLRLSRSGHGFLLQDRDSKNGTRVNGEPCRERRLQDGDIIECGRTFFRFRAHLEAPADDALDVESLALKPAAPGLGTLVPPLARQFGNLSEIALSNLPVLILGQSGTGKELVARAVHQLSQRGGALVPVNCGALSENLVEAELFGCKKGAFTGANEERPGLVRSSDHGTLFLDEVGDLPPRAQPTLLRVLQEQEVLAVGATRALPVDLRVVSATHRHVDELVAGGQFRGDLLARIGAFVLHLPPLTERLEDFGHLVAQLLGPERRTLDLEVVRTLLRHHWPLNIRELRHCLAASATLASSHIELEHLPRALREPRTDVAAATPTPSPYTPRQRPSRPLSPEEQQRREQLLALLADHGGNISEIARQLGKERIQIRRWIKRYQIPLAPFLR